MPLRRLLRRVRRQFKAETPRPAILLYHRIAALAHDPWELAVTPENFEEHIKLLAQQRIPMFVDEMVARLQKGTLPSKAVAVTFDDAYLDNLVNAKPILARYGVPATVFVPTGYVGRELPFWWDELATMVLESREPVHLVQQCGSEAVPVAWDEREPADYKDDWRGWEEPQSKRQTAYFALWSRMQKLTDTERGTIMATLRSKFSVPIDPLARPMNAAELGTLVEGDVVRLGAHTINHSSLPDLSLDESRNEIRGSGEQCRAYTPLPIDGFAYPYGNLTPELCREVQNAGYSWACAVKSEFLDEDTTDVFRLPRISVPDETAQDLTLRLAS